MLRIFRRSEPDTAPVRIARARKGAVVTRVPEFDSITPLGLDRSVPDKADYRLMVRQLIADHADRETLSGAGAALLDHVIEDWHRQWDIAAHEAYLADLTSVEALIASQAGEHADRATARVAVLRRRLADARAAHLVSHFELTGQELAESSPAPDPIVLPRVLSRHADVGRPDEVPAGDPAQASHVPHHPVIVLNGRN
jgi:hypothetical protein